MLTQFNPRVRALGAVAVLALLLSGCSIVEEGPSGAWTSPSVSPSPSAAPITAHEKLTASVPTYRTPSYSWSVVNEGLRDGWTESEGVVNPPAKTYQLVNVVRDVETGVATNWHLRVVHPQTWLRILLDNPQNLEGFPEYPRKWGLIDQELVKDSGLSLAWDLLSKDPARVGLLFRAIVEVRETGPSVFEGTIDLTKAKLAEAVDGEIVTALGPKAKAIPFRALLDSEGRILDVVLKVPASAKSKPITQRIAYRHYGKIPPVVPPTAAETAPTTDDVYELINS
ncbi:hypothetical protein [Cryptosporangium minutisporangium]|uniref:Uncharacterized protein n=1 Tax=Cryptosporangium minutisporangium TaxID=113569 RepID=A0ABP6SQ23_9ACTN